MAAGSAVFMEELDSRDTTARSARQVILQATLLGLLADQVMRDPGEGLGFALWVGALAIAVAIVARVSGRRISVEQYAWLTAAVACAAGAAWRASEQLVALNVLGTLVALALVAMSLSGFPASSVFSAKIRDLIVAGFSSARNAAFGAPLALLDADLGEKIRRSEPARRPAVRAVILTLPLIVVFTTLLSRADPVFASVFALPDMNAEVILSHVVLIGFFTWVTSGWMRGALVPGVKRFTLPDIPAPTLGAVEITTALGTVAALFGIFVAIQARWLFGGADVVLATTGLSVAEYARKGFFELVMVSALVLPLILGTRALATEDTAIARHRALSLTLVVLLGAIMASAVLRMQLYVQNFGLTTDRLYALVFMLWLAVVFAAMVPTILRGWMRPFAAVTVVTGFGALFALNVMNPDAVVARVNLERVTSQPVDYAYLGRLSGDAAPIIAPKLAAAAPSVEACRTALNLRRRWLSPDTHTSLASVRASAAVRTHLTQERVLRLCAA